MELKALGLWPTPQDSVPIFRGPHRVRHHGEEGPMQDPLSSSGSALMAAFSDLSVLADKSGAEIFLS